MCLYVRVNPRPNVGGGEGGGGYRNTPTGEIPEGVRGLTLSWCELYGLIVFSSLFVYARVNPVVRLIVVYT